MSSPSVILKKHARGEYEIGIHTDDGAVVACVSTWDGAGIDRRNEAGRRPRSKRLAEAFSAAMKP